MGKKLTGKALTYFEAKRNVWQEVLDSVREIKVGGDKKTNVEAKTYVLRVRIKSGLSQAEFAPQRWGIRNAPWNNGNRDAASHPAPRSSS